MDIPFADIRITGLDDDLTVESPIRPTLRYVYLRLSQTPPPLWKSYFDDSRKVSRHPHWRRAWIDRKYVVVECIPEEIEKYHLTDLKQDLAHANHQYRDYVQHHSTSDREKVDLAQEERERLREMKSRLTFD